LRVLPTEGGSTEGFTRGRIDGGTLERPEDLSKEGLPDRLRDQGERGFYRRGRERSDRPGAKAPLGRSKGNPRGSYTPVRVKLHKANAV
jgi:hypothetical protein